MAKNYSITFVSLRTATTYTVHIGGGTGAEVPLKGGTQPFMTQEDDSDDMFVPVRTQSGYIRIVDDGYAADDVTAFDWKDLLPKTNTERPVTLTTTSGATTTVHWQGFMQSQAFSGILYGNPQEREFPVQCVLSSLQGASLPSVTAMQNFAWVIAKLVNVVETASGNAVNIYNYVFQGGSDAKLWLLNKVDWQLFLHEVESNLVPRYDAMEVLTDICKFWGWTMRTAGMTAYFTCMDDSSEQGWIAFTKQQMLALTSSTSGETSVTSTVLLSGDIFASVNNEELLTRGVKRAVVKVDVDAEDTTMVFAPEDMEAYMGEPSTWVQQPDEDLVGYFKTGTYYNLTTESKKLSAYTESSIGGFERRVIFSSAEEEEGQNVDVMLIRRDYVEVSGHGTPIIQLATKQAMAYGGGTLSFKGSIFEGAKPISTTDEGCGEYIRVGIGLTHASAKWFWISASGTNPDDVRISHGWNSTQNEVLLSVLGNTFEGIKVIHQAGLYEAILKFPKIPVDDDLYGYLYIDILGGRELDQPYEIADFEVEYTKEQTVLPSSSGEVRPRTIKKKLTTTKEYSAENASTVEDKWNADCIFATDNGLEYGHGLIVGPNGGFVETVQYGGSATNLQHPEQHLANRVASFGNKARRMLTMELRKGAGNVNSVTAKTKVSFDSKTWYPLSISHEWRDDVKAITVVEL